MSFATVRQIPAAHGTSVRWMPNGLKVDTTIRFEFPLLAEQRVRQKCKRKIANKWNNNNFVIHQQQSVSVDSEHTHTIDTYGQEFPWIVWLQFNQFTP